MGIFFQNIKFGVGYTHRAV